MEREKQTRSETNQPEEAPTYERPRIEDYGTLAELTAGAGSGKADFFSGQEGGGGHGYS